jgi:DNA polymerase-3 subunit gamma/tau
MLNTSSTEFTEVKTLGEQLGLETLLAMAQILDQTLVRLRQSTHVRTLVEVAVVRLCKLDDLDQLPALVAALQSGTPLAGPVRPQALPQPPAGQSVRPAPSPPPAERRPAPAAEAQKKMPEGASQSAVDTGPVGPLDEQAAAIAWKQTLGELGDMTADFASKAENVAISAPNRLVVRFRKAYTSAIQFCERPESRQKLEQTLSRITGRQIRIDIAVLPEAVGAAAGTEVAPARRPVNRRQREQEVQRHPLIRKATELFDTEIVTILDAPRSEDSELLPEPAAGETPPTIG